MELQGQEGGPPYSFRVNFPQQAPETMLSRTAAKERIYAIGPQKALALIVVVK
jgi:hypothetical protein